HPPPHRAGLVLDSGPCFRHSQVEPPGAGADPRGVSRCRVSASLSLFAPLALGSLSPTAADSLKSAQSALSTPATGSVSSIPTTGGCGCITTNFKRTFTSAAAVTCWLGFAPSTVPRCPDAPPRLH